MRWVAPNAHAKKYTASIIKTISVCSNNTLEYSYTIDFKSVENEAIGRTSK